MEHKIFKKGTKLYSCSRWDDGEYHLDICTVTDVKKQMTPKGNLRKVVHTLHAENFERADGSRVYETKDSGCYNVSAVGAVMDALKGLFETHTAPAALSPEERLLQSILGETPDPHIAAKEIPSVILDLKRFHSLLAEAYAIDDKVVQKM